MTEKTVGLCIYLNCSEEEIKHMSSTRKFVLCRNSVLHTLFKRYFVCSFLLVVVVGHSGGRLVTYVLSLLSFCSHSVTDRQAGLTNCSIYCHYGSNN